MVVAQSSERIVATLGNGTAPRTRGVDDALLRHVATGDRDAFAALYERHAAAVYGLACRVVRSPALAEEVTQDVFLAVWTQAPGFDRSRGSARTWILTITHRRAVDAVRREQAARNRDAKVATLAAELPTDVVGDRVVEQAAARFRDERLGQAMTSLTELQRGAVELAYFGGLTYAQVAEQLRVPVPTAKSRIRDGLRRLATQLA